MSKWISMAVLALCFFVAAFAFAEAPVEGGYTAAQLRILTAMQQQETGGQPNGGRDAVGDAGASIGPLQIQKAYWTDSKMPGKYEQCKDITYARQVVARYCLRYEPTAWKAGDAETIARVHNGGPGWRKKKAKTDAYWASFKKKLDALK